MFITVDNKSIIDNDILHFPDTSVKLSNSNNVYLVLDNPLTSLSASFKIADDVSDSFELYKLNRYSYDIAVTVGTAAVVGAFTVNGHAVTTALTDTDVTVATALEATMIASNLYYSVTRTGANITVVPLQSGLIIDNAITENTVVDSGFTFTTTVTAPDDILSIVTTQDLTNTDYFQRSGKHVYKLNILFTPKYEEGVHDRNYSYLHNAQLDISYNDGTAHTFTIRTQGRGTHTDANLVVALQNFKKYITEDYYQAFADSSLNTNDQDQVLLNRKRREYLLVLFDLTGFVGAYRSLIAALEYFGWGELLSIKEYWRSVNSPHYKLTDIKNQVLDKVEKQMASYKKSNQMSLTYKVNQAKGTYDSDGLPIYENVLTDTDTVITKLYALKRVLEEDFLTLNTKIIDITGEISSVVGMELNVWLNSSVITDVRLNENINSEIEWELEDTTLFIEEHQALTQQYTYETDVVTPGLEELKFITPTPPTAAFNKTYFDVLQELDDASVLNDFEYATQYVRADFGMIKLNITSIDTSVYQSFRYLLYDFDSGTELFRSLQKPISELSDGVKCGVRMLGDFRFTLILFDHYGGMSVVGIPTKITIENRPINFKIAKHNIDGAYKDLRLSSTMHDMNGANTDFAHVVDTISETLDVNAYNQLTNVPAMTILKQYENNFDMDSVWTRVRELNSIPSSQLTGIPIETWGYKYGTMIYDIIGNGNSGSRFLRMKMFEHNDWSEITLAYNATYASPEIFIQRFIEILNTQPADSVFAKFTYDVNYYSNDPAATLADARPMLRVKAKGQSFLTRHFKYEVQTAFAHADFPECQDKNDVLVFSVLDTSNIIHHNGFTIGGLLKVQVGDKSYANFRPFNDVDELIAELEAWRIADDVTELTFWKRNDGVVVTCQADFSLTHPQFDNHYDIFRGNKGTRIIYVPDGSDIKLAEPIYAFLDDDSKLNSANVTWKLTNALTGEEIVSQYAQAFRYVIIKAGSYTLSCTSTDAYGTTTTIKSGVYLVS